MAEQTRDDAQEIRDAVMRELQLAHSPLNPIGLPECRYIEQQVRERFRQRALSGNQTVDNPPVSSI